MFVAIRNIIIASSFDQRWRGRGIYSGGPPWFNRLARQCVRASICSIWFYRWVAIGPVVLATDMHGRRALPGTNYWLTVGRRWGRTLAREGRGVPSSLPRCESLNYEANTIYDKFSVSSATHRACLRTGHNHPSILWKQACLPILRNEMQETFHQKYGVLCALFHRDDGWRANGVTWAWYASRERLRHIPRVPKLTREKCRNTIVGSLFVESVHHIRHHGKSHCSVPSSNQVSFRPKKKQSGGQPKNEPRARLHAWCSGYPAWRHVNS